MTEYAVVIDSMMLFIPTVQYYHYYHQSGDRRRISTCSGYSTGQTSSGSPRRISGASGASVSGYCSDDSGAMRSQHWRYSFRRYSQYPRWTIQTPLFIEIISLTFRG